MTGIDPNSATWRAVEKWAEDEIEKQRNALELTEISEARGRIKALRALLRLGEPPKPRQTPGATDSYT